jgi:hypothetical protein
MDGGGGVGAAARDSWRGASGRRQVVGQVSIQSLLCVRRCGPWGCQRAQILLPGGQAEAAAPDQCPGAAVYRYAVRSCLQILVFALVGWEGLRERKG